MSGLFVAALATREPSRLSACGKWVLLHDGRPAPSGQRARGLQTSALAWDDGRLWSVGDQRSTYPGHLFAMDPRTGRLELPPMPLSAEQPEIQQRMDSWPRLDLEGIELLPGDASRAVVLVEEDATAAMLVRLDTASCRGHVEALWEFQFSDGEPAPYRGDANFRLEGITFDARALVGYVAFERDATGSPRLFEFDLATAPRRGVGPVQLRSIPFDAWRQLGGKPGALWNANGLAVAHAPDQTPRLLVLCRDRELIVIIDPRTGTLITQLPLDLLSPAGEPIEWASPEGIAFDPDRQVLYIVSDPDSTDGKWRLRTTPRAGGVFAQFVPLLFELKLGSQWWR